LEGFEKWVLVKTEEKIENEGEVGFWGVL